MYRYFLILVLCTIPVFCFSQPPTLVVTIPEQSNITIPYSTYRYGGHTEPGNKVTVNGVQTKVYSTGAFVGLFSLNTGDNVFTFVATNPSGQSKSYTMTIFRTPPPESIPETEIKLDDHNLLPDQDMVLLPGDILKVRVKGTPDAKVMATLAGLYNPIVMQELPVEETNGVKGIYTGTYRIQPGDHIISSPVTFHLSKAGSPETSISSDAKITIDSKTWPRVGIVSVDTIAYLNVGLGQVRLGGVQYGYLPISTRLVLDGIVGNKYRVRLAPTLHAYIPKDFVNELPDGTPYPSSFVGIPTIESNGKFDKIILDTHERLPYIIESFATRPLLRIHIFGVTSNFTWVRSIEPLTLIQDMTWTQVADGHLQIDLHLKEPVTWGYGAGYPDGGNALQVWIRHKPAIAIPPSNPLQGLTIAVDAGHGGRNHGALGATGLLEKDCNLAMAKYLQSKLEALGVKVIMERVPETENVPLFKRIDRALEGNADVMISIHCNSIGMTTDPTKVRGTTVFYKYPFDRELGYDILKRLEKVPGLVQNGLVSNFNFTPNKVTEIPSILVETAYLSYPEEEAVLGSDTGRQEIAQAIVDGLTDYFNAKR